MLLSVATSVAQTPLGSGFTYQGQLNLGGSPVDGTADLEFTLWDAVSGGNQVGATLAANNVSVVNGEFTVDLDFGNDALNGDERYLELAVRSPAGGGTFTTLSPAQPLAVAPYALSAINNWSLSGNAGTDPNTQFLGTTDNQPLELRVNNQSMVRIEPSGLVGTYPAGGNIIAGYQTNAVLAGVRGATISGGGGSNYFGPNIVFDLFGTISGGYTNTIGTDDGDVWSAIGATVSGGVRNAALGSGSAIGGGTNNSADGVNSVVAGGGGNQATMNYAAIGGGENHQVTGRYATIPGGRLNVAAGDNSFAAGEKASALHNGSFVWSDTPVHALEPSFASTGVDQFLVRARGGVGIGDTSPDGPLEVNPDGTEDNGDEFVVDASGNVGIRTNAPLAPLDVRSDGSTIRTQSSAAGMSSYIDMNDGNVRGLIGVDGPGFSGNADQFTIATWTDHALKIFTNQAERMVVTPTGDVGIGVPIPGAKLDVNGTIRSSSGGFVFPDGTVQTTAAGTGRKYIVTTREGNEQGGSGLPPFCPQGWSVESSWDYRIAYDRGTAGFKWVTQTLCSCDCP